MDYKTNRCPVIGVMGGARVTPQINKTAFDLGALIAANGWILLNGGRDAGVMRASAEGAKSKGGLTLGILPGSSKHDANPFIDIPIVTSMASARNLINVLSSDVVVALPGAAGTISEIALALRNSRPVILLQYFLGHCFQEYEENGLLTAAADPAECIKYIHEIISRRG